MPFLRRPNLTINRRGRRFPEFMAQALGRGAPGRAEWAALLCSSVTQIAQPSAAPHLLIAPARCLQQRTDYSDGRQVKRGPSLAVTTQNNLSPEQLTASTWHLPNRELAGGIG